MSYVMSRRFGNLLTLSERAFWPRAAAQLDVAVLNCPGVSGGRFTGCVTA
jgi:hypothetical protein